MLYGKSGYPLDLSGINYTLLEPRFVEGLPDEEAAFREAMEHPIGCEPLGGKVRADEKVVIVIPDITRALPTQRLLTWLFGEFERLPVKNVTILSGTGSHRPHTNGEWVGMVGERIFRSFRCIDHLGTDAATHALAGQSAFGYDVYLNREYIEADRRILLGFIEPHFMAGFSGGYKAAFPGLAAVDTIMRYHNAENIGHPLSAWGILEGNPTQAHVRAGGSLVPVDLLINVTLNRKQQITGFFIGDPIAAHEEGCRFCKETAMVPCEQPFPVVVTTNSGYPLDQNLYQTVKGFSAAGQVVQPGGLILALSRCNDGFPDHGNFKAFLFEHETPESLLEEIHAPGFARMDQWQVQIMANILLKARIALYSELEPDDVQQALLEPVWDVRQRLLQELGRIGRDAPVAVMPEGPLTIPYLA